jgi:TonB-dependent receptor
MTLTQAGRRLQLLSATAFLGTLLTGTSGFAQNATAGTEGAAVETIVVRASRPIQESDRAALQIQRASPSLVSVVSADEAGRLADQNIAQALSRLPGIAVERDQGQARYINLRGQPRRWTNVSIDGMSVVSPEGRDTRFDNIPSAIASQIIVNKAITPDMSGDTVSGNVNIRTRSAFDYKGFAARGGLQLGYVELGEGAEIDASLVLSNRFFGDKLGVLAQASYYYRDMVTNNWETDPYLRPGGTVQGGIDRRPGSETRRWAREFENKLYRLERGNFSGSLRADFRPTDLDKLFAQTVYTQFTDDELRNNYIFRFDARAVPQFCESIRYGK